MKKTVAKRKIPALNKLTSRLIFIGKSIASIIFNLPLVLALVFIIIYERRKNEPYKSRRITFSGYMVKTWVEREKDELIITT